MNINNSMIQSLMPRYKQVCSIIPNKLVLLRVKMLN